MYPANSEGKRIEWLVIPSCNCSFGNFGCGKAMSFDGLFRKDRPNHDAAVNSESFRCRWVWNVRCMNSISRRRSRISLVAMIVGGLVTVAPVFGPLGKTLHYLSDFIAERPQSMRTPDLSFFIELLALIVCPFGLIIFAISLVFFIRSGRPPRAARWQWRRI